MKQPEKFGYVVKLHRHCDHSEREDEPYGSWKESWSNEFISVKRDNKFSDLTSVNDFKSGEVAYLVWAEWSSGDSFGCADGYGAEAVAILRHGVDAFDLADKLRNAKVNDTGNFNDRCTFKWESSDGEVFESGFLPWLGYFESLDAVHVECVQF